MLKAIGATGLAGVGLGSATTAAAQSESEVRGRNRQSLTGDLSASIDYLPSTVTDGDEETAVAAVTGGEGPYSYSWSVAKDGNPYVGDGSGPTTSISFVGPSRYSVKVDVTDEATGETASATQAVDVEAADLEVSLDGPSSPTVGESHTFEPDVTGGAGDVDLEWEVSLGSLRYVDAGTGDSLDLEFHYEQEYAVKVTATDAEDESASAVASFVPEEEPVSVAIDNVPSTATVGDSVDAVAVVENAQGSIEYEWSVSQGTSYSAYANSDEPTWTYDFQTATDYAIKVEVTDEATGDTAAASTTVSVEADDSGSDDGDDCEYPSNPPKGGWGGCP